MDNLYEKIGANIRAVRKSRKQTQYELAKAIGKSQSAITAIELGERRITLESIIRLCKFYEISVNDIIPSSNDTPIGDELLAEKTFLKTLESKHFTADEQQLILDFTNLILKGRSVNIGESHDQRQE